MKYAWVSNKAQVGIALPVPFKLLHLSLYELSSLEMLAELCVI